MTNINIMMDGEFADKIHRYAFLTSIVASKFEELRSVTTQKEKDDVTASLLISANKAMDVARDLCIDPSAPTWLVGADEMYQEINDG
jgi:hypothetical protein|tara:strand:+ start:415 stop:675 length:261 start_codon:yes stop_codon:yes gene_type:complete